MITRRTFISGLAAGALAGCMDTSRTSAPVVASPPPPAPEAPPSGGAGILDAVIDIHHHNVIRDLPLAKNKGGLLGIIHKVTEGVGWVDPKYDERRAMAERNGLLWGAYHFGTTQYSGREQAQAFLASARPTDSTLLALDLELNERVPNNSMNLWQAEDFVRTIYETVGRLPVIYVQASWADGQMVGKGKSKRSLGAPIAAGSILSACDLWLADYRAQPRLPQAWVSKGWTFWQYCGDGAGGGPFKDAAKAIPGIDSADRNLFVGDVWRLRRYWTEESGRLLAATNRS